MSQQSRCSRLLAPLLLAVLLVGLGYMPATPARPVTTSLMVSLSGTTSYPPDLCLPIGDVVVLSGQVHVVSQVVMLPSGTFVKVHVNAADVQGLSTSGLTYDGAGAVQLSFSALPSSTTATLRLVPPDPCPAKPLVIKLGLTFDADGSLTAATAGAVANGIIAYSSVTGGFQELFTIQSDGTANTQITRASANYGLPSWNSAGTKLITSYSSGSTKEVRQMNPDGTGEITVISNAQNGQYSADGTKIVFLRPTLAEQFDTTLGVGDIWTVGSDGVANPMQLTTSSSTTTFAHPSWSPDGTKIVFVRVLKHCCNYPVDVQVWVMNANGSEQQRLSFPGLVDVGLGVGAFEANQCAWEWNGQIVFWSGDPSIGGRIWKMNSDGTSRTQVTTQADATLDFSPEWSPDGRKIVFLRVTGPTSQYFTMNSDGTSQTALATATSGGVYVLEAAWQPQ